MYQLINSLANKMKRPYITNFLFGFLLLAATSISSCSNEDLEKEDYESGTRTITFDVSQSFEENSDEESRAISEQADTIYQKFADGMEIVTVVEQDKSTDSRAATTEVVKEGTKILAIVIDENDKVHRIQQVQVEEYYKLTCEIPDNKSVRVLFYSYNSTSKFPAAPLAVGDKLTTSTKADVSFGDAGAMIAETGTILPGAPHIGNVTFKHLFSRAQFCVHYDKGVSSFSMQAQNMTSIMATVNIKNKVMEACLSSYNGLVYMGNSALSNETLYSNIWNFIPRSDAMPFTVSISKLNGDNLTNKNTTVTKKFQPGYSYTIHMYIKSKTLGKIVDGWSDYYEWDARDPCFAGQTPPQPGSPSYYNYNYTSAVQSCKDSPTREEFERMIATGAYWDENGPEWTGANGNKYTRGVWVLKNKSKWSTARKTLDNLKIAGDEQRYSGDYVFLPLSGIIDNASNPANTIAVNEWGVYWGKDQCSLIFDTVNIYMEDFGPKQGLAICNFPN